MLKTIKTASILCLMGFLSFSELMAQRIIQDEELSGLIGIKGDTILSPEWTDVFPLHPHINLYIYQRGIQFGLAADTGIVLDCKYDLEKINDNCSIFNSTFERQVLVIQPRTTPGQWVLHEIIADELYPINDAYLGFRKGDRYGAFSTSRVDVPVMPAIAPFPVQKGMGMGLYSKSPHAEMQVYKQNKLGEWMSFPIYSNKPETFDSLLYYNHSETGQMMFYHLLTGESLPSYPPSDFNQRFRFNEELGMVERKTSLKKGWRIELINPYTGEVIFTTDGKWLHTVELRHAPGTPVDEKAITIRIDHRNRIQYSYYGKLEGYTYTPYPKVIRESRGVTGGKVPFFMPHDD